MRIVLAVALAASTIMSIVICWGREDEGDDVGASSARSTAALCAAALALLIKKDDDWVSL